METANNNNSTWIPEWILREQADAEREADRRKAESAQQAMAAMTITTEGPGFWSDFVSELDRNARGVERLGIKGRVSVFPANNSTRDHHCRVELSRLGEIPDPA
jgi:hypothetical protein